MFRNKAWMISTLFIAMDAIVIYEIFRLTTFIRRMMAPLLQRPPLPWAHVSSVANLGILLIIGIFLLQGLYPGYGLTAIKELERMGKSTTLAFILVASISYLVKSYQIFPRSILPIAWVLAVAILPVTRFITRNLVSRTKFYGRPVVIFGEGESAKDLSRSLRRVSRLGWVPTETRSLKNMVFGRQYGPDHIAILSPPPDILLADLVRELNHHFRRVILIRKAENYGSLWVETRDLDGYLGLEFQYHLLARRSRWLKRGIDILGAIFLLTLFSPLLLALSLWVAVSSPGPVFFRQERLGKDFKRFGVIKFRTMVVGAEEKLVQILAEDPLARAKYEEFHKLEKDPRVTPGGNFLRKFSLDELPQFWNVLKGEMSLSGPRAYMPAELEDIGSYAATILRVPPGITGWWQVLGRHQTSFQQRLEMDEYYISNWSLWMDSYIFLKTILVVLSGSGK